MTSNITLSGAQLYIADSTGIDKIIVHTDQEIIRGQKELLALPKILSIKQCGMIVYIILKL